MEPTQKGLIDYLDERAHLVPAIGKTMKFQLDGGIVFIDLKSDPPRIHQDNLEADCTVSTDTETLAQVLSGDLHPMVAAMTRRLRFQGDIEVAITLQSLFI